MELTTEKLWVHILDDVPYASRATTEHGLRLVCWMKHAPQVEVTAWVQRLDRVNDVVQHIIDDPAGYAKNFLGHKATGGEFRWILDDPCVQGFADDGERVALAMGTHKL